MSAGSPAVKLVPDPRDPRGVRHTLTWLLLAALAAVLAEAQTLAAVGEWVADALPQVLAALGIRRDPLAGRFQPPAAAAIGRVLQAVDDAALASIAVALGVGPLWEGGAPGARPSSARRLLSGGRPGVTEVQWTSRR